MNIPFVKASPFAHFVILPVWPAPKTNIGRCQHGINFLSHNADQRRFKREGSSSRLRKAQCSIGGDSSPPRNFDTHPSAAAFPVHIRTYMLHMQTSCEWYSSVLALPLNLSHRSMHERQNPIMLR